MPSQTQAQFGFTKIIVSDVDRLLAFYRDVFGLAQVSRIKQGEGDFELDEIIMATAGSSQLIPSLVIQRYPNRPVPAPGEATLGFIVNDLERTLAAATAAGATIERPAWTASEHGVRVAFLKDIDGHLVEVVQTL